MCIADEMTNGGNAEQHSLHNYAVYVMDFSLVCLGICVLPFVPWSLVFAFDFDSDAGGISLTANRAR